MRPKRAQTSSRLFLAFDSALLRAIVEITSQRGGLTDTQSSELLSLVIARLSASDHPRIREYQDTVALESYLAVAVQELALERCRDDVNQRGPAPNSASDADADLEAAITGLVSTLPATEALALKMWFERGMTSQLIARALRMESRRVHALISESTQRIQDLLAPDESATGAVRRRHDGIA